MRDASARPLQIPTSGTIKRDGECPVTVCTKCTKISKRLPTSLTKLCKLFKKTLTNLHFVVQYKVGKISVMLMSVHKAFKYFYRSEQAVFPPALSG